MKSFIHLLLITLALSLTSTADDYAVVVSKATYANKDWQSVVTALVKKHEAKVIEHDGDVAGALGKLRGQFPRYTCFVATPKEATGTFVAQVHQLTRKLDDDPYTDTMWGILTGYNAANALAIAQHAQPLTVRKVASGTEIALECVTEGLWYDELVKNKFVRKKPGGPAEELRGPDDTTEAFTKVLADYEPDLFITSGHATEGGWQIGFRYRNGFLKSKAGQMFGENTRRERFEIKSTNPKVYLPIGNCLMGNINGPDAMALAWMNDVSVMQMIGYTKPTWFGYQGWGVLDYYVEQPGRYTLTEAFFANHHALIHRLRDSATPRGDLRGLAFDRDVVAYYGDPKWSAKLAPGKLAYGQKLKRQGNTYTLTITPKQGDASFATVNNNGSQRGGRPIVAFLPHRVSQVQLLEGGDLSPVIADDFILVPRPKQDAGKRSLQVKFTAKPVK
ncbi:MAG: hypothetical protein H8E27_05455 [Verrucomicrobia subdivision 3 bacterium]|nr:hypothetical protein [Limisphaerales bacterium]